MRIDTHVGLTPPQQRGQTSLDSNSRDSGVRPAERESLYTHQPPASTPGSEGRATGRGLRPSAEHPKRSDDAIAGSEERAGNRDERPGTASGAAAEHRGAQRRIATAGAKRETGTSDRTGPPAIRRAHRAEGECAIAGSEERAGLIGTKPGRWT